MISPKPIKILVISPFFYPHIGGSQQYMENLYATLKKSHPEIEINVLCYNTGSVKQSEPYQGMLIQRLPCWSILPGQFALPKPIPLIKFLFKNRHGYDLIHVSTRFFDSAFWAPLYAKLIKVPVFLTDHCAYYPVHPNPVISAVAKSIDLTLVRFPLRFYTKIFATNKAAKTFLKSTFGVDAKLSYGGINATLKFRNKRAGRKIKIVFLGRMIVSKGAQILFEIAKTIPEVDFTFAGPGPLVEIFKDEIKRRRITHIRILGSLNRSKVEKLLSGSDILVHPSIHSEGFPNVLTEAGAAGLAVIATDVGGSKEIIIDQKTGLLVKPGDKQALEKSLKKLIKSKGLRKKLGKSLHTHVKKNFSWKKNNGLLYKEILSSL